MSYHLKGAFNSSYSTATKGEENTAGEGDEGKGSRHVLLVVSVSLDVSGACLRTVDEVLSDDEFS